MRDDDAAWLAREQRRRWVRPDFERYLRPDWERYVHPAGHEAVRQEIALCKAAFETPRMRRLRAEQELRERAEQLALERKLAAIQQEYEARERAWQTECAERKRKAECAARKAKADRAWERLIATLMRRDFARKANFNPDQPRDEIGRWTEGGQEANDASDSQVMSDAEPDNEWIPGAQYAANAGERPPPLGHNNPPPEVPEGRPETAQERNSIVKDVARWFGRAASRSGALGIVIGGASWLADYESKIVASADPPKSLGELHDAVGSPRAGYEKHHIVEQTSARQDGYSSTKIDGPDNLVQIPTLKHREITSWYQTKSPEFGGLSPRDYLRGRSWEERREIGLRALRDVWVLKP